MRLIVGAIYTADLLPGAFDVIYSSFVLEHIAEATRAGELQQVARVRRPALAPTWGSTVSAHATGFR